jgi:hypothetical protein
LGGLAVVGVVACGDGLPKPVSLEIVTASDGQIAAAGAVVPEPLAVRVTADDGTRAVRAEVRWRVVAGTGALLSDTVTVSDGLGEAQVWLTLGPTEGEYQVQAELVAAPSQTVRLLALAAAPVRVTSV